MSAVRSRMGKRRRIERAGKRDREEGQGGQSARETGADMKDGLQWELGIKLGRRECALRLWEGSRAEGWSQI